MSKTFLFTVRTKNGIKFHIEACSPLEAEQRARHPAIAREIATMLSTALADIESVEWHHGPRHLVNERLVFRDEIFR